MDGVLVVDKPEGITSHDVVAVARRSLREARIGHTGTLDPLATGVLPLACGRATRLVRFLVPADKDYEAVIRFGLTTDSYDITGREVARADTLPDRAAIDQALPALRGEYEQRPPAYSAKRIGRHRAYTLARRDEPVELKAVPVRVSRVELVEYAEGCARILLTCSAGFYVRTFAHVLGELVGTGACLAALRRTRSGEFRVESATSFDEVASRPAAVLEQVIPLDRLLPWMPAAQLTREGQHRVIHGREIESAHIQAGLEVDVPRTDALSWTRLLDADGHLLALGQQGEAPGSLHPAIVLI